MAEQYRVANPQKGQFLYVVYLSNFSYFLNSNLSFTNNNLIEAIILLAKISRHALRLANITDDRLLVF